MYKFIKVSFLLFLPLILLSCSKEKTLSEITIFNSSDFSFSKAAVSIKLDKLLFDTENKLFSLILKGDTETSIPYQLDDLDNDGKSDELFFQLDFAPNEIKSIIITESQEKPTFTKFTDGVLKVRDTPDPQSMQVGDDFENVDYYEIPSNLKQDNGLVFLEGPTWESNLIGYRFYIDNRTRFDIFGKTTTDLVLANVSGDYHEIGDWGADVLSVGSSLGMGSPAVITNDCIRTIDDVGAKTIEIISNGPLRTIIRTTYSQWNLPSQKVDLVMNLEIHAHHRYTKISLESTSDNLLNNLTTGIVKHPTLPEIKSTKKTEALVASSWGKHSYHADLLGKALIVHNKYNPTVNNSDESTYLVTMNNSKGYYEYYILAAWGLEPENSRIKDEKEFEALLKNETNQLFSDLIISFETN